MAGNITDAQQGSQSRGDYVTYVPAGEHCMDCGELIETPHRVWRVAADRRAGTPGGYRHYEPCTPASPR